MTSYMLFVFRSACAILLILSCLGSGCTMLQKSPATLAAVSSPPGVSGTITIKDSAFNPVNLTIRSGTTVTGKRRVIFIYV